MRSLLLAFSLFVFFPSSTIGAQNQTGAQKDGHDGGTPPWPPACPPKLARTPRATLLRAKAGYFSAGWRMPEPLMV
jgi:hypothetical protein